MNGVLNILKPPGMTSFDVIARLRRLLKIRKIGHTGTLDPLAAGVLQVCVGSATKAIEYLIEKDKLYRAELCLGIATDTQDASGTILARSEVNSTDEEIESAIKGFEGRYLQTPPMYSALKVNGKKLYELAREGESIERQPREVHIYKAAVVRIERDNGVRVLFDVHCSKGTYIRTLCSDIGEKLGCGGHMSFLLRQRAGAFELRDSLTLEEVEELLGQGKLESRLIRTEEVLGFLMDVRLDPSQEKKFSNGLKIPLEACGNGRVRVFNSEGGFIAVGRLLDAGGTTLLKSEKFFAST